MQINYNRTTPQGPLFAGVGINAGYSGNLAQGGRKIKRKMKIILGITHEEVSIPKGIYLFPIVNGKKLSFNQELGELLKDLDNLLSGQFEVNGEVRTYGDYPVKRHHRIHQSGI